MGVGLSREQRNAVNTEAPQALVTAGAGSGKTTVVAARFLKLVKEGAPVDSIAVVTFTRKAAREMLERIHRSMLHEGMADEARQLELAYISTIDGFCARLLRSHPFAAGLGPTVRVAGELETQIHQRRAFRLAVQQLLAEHPQLDDFTARFSLFPKGESDTSSLERLIIGTYEKLRSLGSARPRLPKPAPSDFNKAKENLLQAIETAYAQAAADKTTTRNSTNAQTLLGLRQIIPELQPWQPRDQPPAGKILSASGPKFAYVGPYLAAWSEFERAYYGQQAAIYYGLISALFDLYADNFSSLKREEDVLDFHDLSFAALRLLTENPDISARYTRKFTELIIDEFQDTNHLQCTLFEAIRPERLFLVGDQQQSIYRFRNADVRIIQKRRDDPAYATFPLTGNFRSLTEIIQVINRIFSHQALMGDNYQYLQAKAEAPAVEDPVELVLWPARWSSADFHRIEADWAAERIVKLVNSGGFSAGDIAIILRRTTQLRFYEDALSRRGVPYFVTRGKGYFDVSEVADLTAMLRLVDNPRDDYAMLTVLRSPIAKVSDDALYLLARARSEAPFWELLQSGEFQALPLSTNDKVSLEKFVARLTDFRRRRHQTHISGLIDFICESTLYDISLLAAGENRAVANLRKLTRLAAEYERDAGLDLHGFLRLIDEAQDVRLNEGEAAMSAEDVDSVRLMTVHASKGLEFPVVFLLDSGPHKGGGEGRSSSLLTDGQRIGIRFQSAPSNNAECFDYACLDQEEKAADREEKKRLLYVAMTRAKRKLIISGQMRTKPDKNKLPENPCPVDYLCHALEIDASALEPRPVDLHTAGVDISGVRVTRFGDQEISLTATQMRRADRESKTEQVITPRLLAPAQRSKFPMPVLSYSALDELRVSPRHFFLKHVLGLDEQTLATYGEPPSAAEALVPDSDPQKGARRARAIGLATHEILEALDFSKPRLPDALSIGTLIERHDPEAVRNDAERIAGFLQAFVNSSTFAEVASAPVIYTEMPFSFRLSGCDIVGNMDLVAPLPDRLLICDYKTNSLEGTSPDEQAGKYDMQKTVYALAGLRLVKAGRVFPGTTGGEVEFRLVFLERPDEPVSFVFTIEDATELAAPIEKLIDTYIEPGYFPVEPVK